MILKTVFQKVFSHCSYSPMVVRADIYLHDLRGQLVDEVEICIVVKMLVWSLVWDYLHSSPFISLFLDPLGAGKLILS